MGGSRTLLCVIEPAEVLPLSAGGDDRRRRLEQLYEAHASAVFAYARRRASWADADEVVSETFLIAWRRLDQVPAHDRAWLIGVARKVLANRNRSEARQQRVRRRLVVAAAPADDSTEVADGRVKSALARLSPTDREALTMLAWDGLSPAEIGTALGCSRAAAYVRIHRARRRFAALLAATTSPEGDQE
jgi:RNA polymerase sigma factor (sigma-70 family)